MRSFLLFIHILTFNFSFSQETTFSSLESLISLVSSKATEADSIIKSKGFVNSDVNGLMIIYLKNNERLSFQSNPREVLLQSTSKDSYLKISNQVADDYSLVSNNDTMVINAKSYKVSTFESDLYRISFWTEYNSTKKTNLYFIRIIKKAIISSGVNTKISTTPEEQTVQTNKEEIKTSNGKENSKTITFKKPTKKATSDTLKLNIQPIQSADGGIPCKKIKYTGGIGLYGYVRPEWVGKYSNLRETLLAYNLGVEISRTNKMTQKGKNFTNSRIDINATSFTGMQRYYEEGITEPYQTIFLSKHYLTIGYISELRRKNESLLMSICPGLNWTTGKLDDVDRKGFVTGTIQMGEYYQHNFWSKKKSKEMFSMRVGFEQFFSLKGGYIGQFAFTFGI